MNKKSTLLAVFMLLLVFSNQLLAQALYPVSLEEKAQHSTLIAEGTVVSKSSFWNPAHSIIFTSNKIKLHKIFKGQLQPEFIEVVTTGGTVGNDQLEVSELADLRIGETGMFFCFPSVINLRNPATNTLLWDIYSSAQGFVKYDLSSKIADAPFAAYDNIVNSLYPAVMAKTGRTFTNVDQQFNVGTEPIPQSEVLGITSFSPVNVAAGATADPAKNLLTITGTDFGLPQGSAAVLFDDANNGTGGVAFTVLFNDPLIVSWTATEIQVRVPSRAGTGVIQVRDEFGSTVASAATLRVDYSILTATFAGAPNFTTQSNLMNDNGLGGYTVLYSTSVASGGVDLDASPTKATFQRALNTWKEISGFNVVEGGTTAVQQINPSNNLNVIMFDNLATGNAPLAAGVLAVCYSFNTVCTPVGSFASRKVEFDIVIRNTGVSTGTTTFENGPCYPNASGADIDMEAVLLHELGHALNLGHINDDYQYTGSGSYPAVNPGKLMHYAVLSGVARRSPDWSAYIGAQYTIIPKGYSYGACPGPFFELTPLIPIVETKDECPGSFPAAATAGNTLVNFDLVHATSNKNVDPQYTAVNCLGSGRPVTNTAFYAIKTNTAGTLDLTVTGYTVNPASQASCLNAGVKLALYQVSNCPTGQAYPAPVACRTFNADGALASITGLLANSNYLIFVDGNYATKANFNLLLNGTALPVRITNFTGAVKALYNDIFWNLETSSDLRSIILQSGNDGNNFTDAYLQTPAPNSQRISGSFQDVDMAGKKYYRLKIINMDGSIEYSSILLLRREVKANTVIISPNPANDHVNIVINREKAASLTISVVDAAGKKLMTRTQLASAGIQTIQLNDIERLATGNYIIQIWDGEKMTSHKLIKQ